MLADDQTTAEIDVEMPYSPVLVISRLPNAYSDNTTSSPTRNSPLGRLCCVQRSHSSTPLSPSRRAPPTATQTGCAAPSGTCSGPPGDRRSARERDAMDSRSRATNAMRMTSASCHALRVAERLLYRAEGYLASYTFNHRYSRWVGE